MLFNCLFDKPAYVVGVVIPIYKIVLNDYEKISLERCLKVLGNHPVIILAPENLKVAEIELLFGINYEVRYFPAHFFESVDSYSRLMLNPEFYHRFNDFRHILIYQLDAFVFTDQLRHWCDLGYDYLGAPWFGVDWFEQYKRPGFGNFWNVFGNKTRMVGNGGFSLRRVKSFLLALKLLKTEANAWTENEDLFWSFEVTNQLPFFKIPDVDRALQFSFELNPRDCYLENKNMLPFGCHAWEKYDIDFWRPFFHDVGYTI